jgi:transcriptional regulator with XRE-family HTH domain
MAEIADRAGVGITTVQRLERGQNSSLESLIRVLRALGRLQALDALLSSGEALPSPRAIARLGGKERVRASGKRSDG